MLYGTWVQSLQHRLQETLQFVHVALKENSCPTNQDT